MLLLLLLSPPCCLCPHPICYCTPPCCYCSCLQALPCADKYRLPGCGIGEELSGELGPPSAHTNMGPGHSPHMHAHTHIYCHCTHALLLPLHARTATATACTHCYCRCMHTLLLPLHAHTATAAGGVLINVVSRSEAIKLGSVRCSHMLWNSDHR